MTELSIELAAEDPSYEDMCLKFVEHFLWIASAMNRTGPDGMWDEEDGFYYDVLRTPDGTGAAAQGPFDGGTAAPVRYDGHRRAAAGACAACSERIDPSSAAAAVAAP